MQKLQPQLAEFLRTCVQPPWLLLQVTHVEQLDVKHDRHDKPEASSQTSAPHYDNAHRHATRLILSDGELMIQALLHRRPGTLKDAATIRIGDLLKVEEFRLKQSARQSNQGRVLFLAIEKCSPVSDLEEKEPEHDKSGAGLDDEGSKKRKRSLAAAESTIDAEYADSEVEDVLGGGSRASPSKRRKPQGDAGFRSLLYEVETSAHSHLSPEDLLSPDLQLSQLDGADGESPMFKNTKQTIFSAQRQERVGATTEKNSLSTAFGARRVLPDDEDEDGFFEPHKSDRTMMDERRKILQKLEINRPSRQHSPIANEAIPRCEHLQNTPIMENNNSDTSLAQFETTGQPRKEEQDNALPEMPNAGQQPPNREGAFMLPQTLEQFPPNHQHITSIPPKSGRSPVPQPQTQPRTQLQILPSPTFHTLGSLRKPPTSQPLPNKNYILATLAFITWAGATLIHRPGSPFPPKRHLKIIDPTLSSSRPPSRETQPRPQTEVATGTSNFKAQTAFQDAVTVAVYLDAANFRPAAGTLALFRGVVMQRLPNGDVILNAYSRLKDQRFNDDPTVDIGDTITAAKVNDSSSVDADSSLDSHWFITDRDKIRSLGYGSKLDYYLEWYSAKQR